MKRSRRAISGGVAEPDRRGAGGIGPYALSFRTLWLPLEDPARAWVTCGVVFLVYLLTMSRDISYYDSGELALAAYQLGLGHPIGQPTHTMIGWVLAHLPLVPSLFGLNLLSALFGALVMIPAMCLVETLGDRRPRGVTHDALVRWVPPLVLLCFAQHLPLWDAATRVEVYALATFPAFWGTARVLAALSYSDLEANARYWLVAGVAFGLGACANVLMAGLLALSIAPSLLLAVFRAKIEKRSLLLIVVGGLLGLLPFSYVLLIGQWPGDAFVWGAPADYERIVFYFQGVDYTANRGVAATAFVHNLVLWSEWGMRTTVLPLMVVGIGGHLALSWRSGVGRPLALMLGIVTVVDICRKGAFHPEVLDAIDYLGPPFLMAAIGMAALFQDAVRPTRRLRLFYLTGVAMLMSTPLLSDPAVHQRTRSADGTTRMLAEEALGEAPEKAVMLVYSDHWAAPLLYVQEAEGMRPDVVVLPYGLGASSWYWEHVFKRHPELRRVQLRAPGGKNARIRRLLDANADRPVVVQNWNLAQQVGESVCDVGWLLHCGRSCAGAATLTNDADERLRAALHTVGFGSPPAHEVIAAVALDRGEALWRLGRNGEALDALLAGVHAELLPVDAANTRIVTGLPLRGPLPSWRRHTPVSDPARNLFMAASLLAASGERESARSFLEAALDDGLPEALSSARQ